MKKHRKMLAVSLMGTMLEYYEFTIFAIFALQISQAFFNELDEFTRIIRTLGLFTAGFIARPLGSVVFGYIGDRFGRKVALSITIIGMSCATLAIAATPTHQAIGIAAPILLLIFRLLQGLFLGGEGAGSAVYLLEHELKYHPNLIGGVLTSVNVMGILSASGIAALIEHYVGLNNHSWRLAFILGGGLGLIVGYLRTQLSESLQFDKLGKDERLRAPIKQVFSKYWREVALVTAFGSLASSSSYVIKAFMAIYLQSFLRLNPSDAFQYLIFASVIFAALPPFFGQFSSRYKINSFIRASAWASIILTVPAFYLVSSGHPVPLMVGLAILSSVAAAVCTPQYTYPSQMFPISVRYSGVAISYNLGVALVGGFMPLIGAYLIDRYRNLLSPGIYITALAIIYLCIDSCLRRRRKQ